MEYIFGLTYHSSATLTYKNPNKILKFKYVHDFVADFNKTFL